MNESRKLAAHRITLELLTERGVQVADLQAENATLRERVEVLEGALRSKPCGCGDDGLPISNCGADACRRCAALSAGSLPAEGEKCRACGKPGALDAEGDCPACGGGCGHERYGE